MAFFNGLSGFYRVLKNITKMKKKEVETTEATKEALQETTEDFFFIFYLFLTCHSTIFPKTAFFFALLNLINI